jgi:DNA-directed RNA polymerase specialized sigma24 family protein
MGPPRDVEEVLHETFVRAYRGIGKFRWQEDDAFFRWL